MSTKQRKAIIVGSGGQDGRHLAELLVRHDYTVLGVTRASLDIAEKSQVQELIGAVQPDEVYLLAAYHHSAESAPESDDERFDKSHVVHVAATIHFLEAIFRFSPATRLFFASSSHIFPDSGPCLLDEDSPVKPSNVYAITKYGGMLACRYYREQKGVFASCGILFNHESSLRPAHFLSRKIAIAAAKISRGESNLVELGNLDVIVDWGYAPDYVDAMRRILQVKCARDYVVATGEPHSVREFADIAFRRVGLDYRDYVRINPELLTKHVETRLGNSRRLSLDTGWFRTRNFSGMVEGMVDAEIGGMSA